MMMMMTSMIMLIMLVMLMSSIYKIISKKTSMDREKMSPFECGFDPLKSARKPFSIQFFLLAVLFLIFDIEITLIIPIIITMKWSMASSWVLTITLFLIILMLGLYHEWKNGMLEWAS
uniref:NADH dehydrogenase subunit 3 n=1 Tax=Megacopta cribriella TaxID=2968964 RepID=UPI0022388BAD|nr:NADH dehydrogenase subunit 3 [Megacopta cribriella]UYA97726.1 NADH dehydrogenase subunit 3 [Megacopta cribriella]